MPAMLLKLMSSWLNLEQILQELFCTPEFKRWPFTTKSHVKVRRNWFLFSIQILIVLYKNLQWRLLQHLSKRVWAPCSSMLLPAIEAGCYQLELSQSNSSDVCFSQDTDTNFGTFFNISNFYASWSYWLSFLF